MKDLYIAKYIQTYKGIKFQKVLKLKEEKGVVTFSTEWPVMVLNTDTAYWRLNFKKWN